MRSNKIKLVRIVKLGFQSPFQGRGLAFNQEIFSRLPACPEGWSFGWVSTPANPFLRPVERQNQPAQTREPKI
jgi:hypothetical protein